MNGDTEIRFSGAKVEILSSSKTIRLWPLLCDFSRVKCNFYYISQLT